MMKVLATLATLLLAATLGFAQAGQAGMQSNQSSMSQNTVRGCLTGTKGNYRLVANDGNTYRLKAKKNDDLQDNVGKEVEIQTSSAITPNASAGGSMAGQSASARTTQTLQVQDVTKVADSCQTSGMQGQSGQTDQYGGHSDQSPTPTPTPTPQQ